jgi:hypothetical protein
MQDRNLFGGRTNFIAFRILKNSCFISQSKYEFFVGNPHFEEHSFLSFLFPLSLSYDLYHIRDS